MKYTKSSGNVFEDLGFNPAEAAILKAKTECMIHIEKWFKASRLTQAQAAETLGVTRPRMNRLLKGDFDGITLDKMTDMSTRIGLTVEIRVKRKRSVAA